MKKVLCSVLALCLLASSMVFANGQGESASGTAGKKVSIALIPPGMVSPFYQGIIKGAKQAAAKYDYDLKILAPERENDYAGLLKIVEDMITTKVDAIALCSIDTETTIAAVQKANKAGIPVVIFNSLVEVPKVNVFAYVGYDQRIAGKKVAQYLLDTYKGKQFNVVVIEGLPSSFTTEREGGFKDIAANNPLLKVVAAQPGDWEREKSMNVATNLLQANPDINMFYGLSDEMALGAGQACKAAGKTGVVIIGIDGNPNTLDAVEKGDVTGTCSTNPPLIGSTTIDTINKALNKQTSPKMVVTDTVIIDKTNVEKYK